MRKRPLLLGAGAALMVSVWASDVVMAADEGAAKAITSGSVKPHLGNGPADEKSLSPSASAPAPTTTAKTGASDQSNTVKAMNDSEKNKVEAEGK